GASPGARRARPTGPDPLRRVRARHVRAGADMGTSPRRETLRRALCSAGCSAERTPRSCGPVLRADHDRPLRAVPMPMGRRAFLASATFGMGGLAAGCSSPFRPGGAGTRTDSEEGPADAAAVLDEAQVAELPDDAIPETTEPAAPEGYVWAWEVTFSAPRDQVEAWLVESFGSADVAQNVHTLDPAV